MIMIRIDQAKADGRLGDTPAVDIALALASLAQGLVSMQRANRFSSDGGKRAAEAVGVFQANGPADFKQASEKQNDPRHEDPINR